MRKVFGHLLVAVVLTTGMGTFISCSDDDTIDVLEKAPEVNIPEATTEEVSKELSSIAKALKEIQGDDLLISDFITQFSNASFDLNTDELTVFAFEDDRDENPDEFETSLRSVENKTTTTKNIYHHILRGKHNLNYVTADKEYVYKTINGTELIISKRNNVMYVNGIAMRKNEYYKNNHGKHSHIYIVKNEVPEDQISASKVKNVYDIKVVNVNTGNTANPYTASKDAFIIVFEENEYGGYRQIDKVRTNDEGYASIFYNGDKNIYYKASNQGYKYIYKGFMVAGMYQSEEEVKNALPHTGMSPIFTPKLGGIKFLDVNGDGTIDFNDKKGPKFIKLDKKSNLNTIYLANPQY